MNDLVDNLGVASYHSFMDKRARFLKKVDVNGPVPDQELPHYKGLKACHVWTAGKSCEGYGKHTYNYRTIPAHRFAWELENGPIPDGLCVLHRCDNPSCVNPEHLFLGTQGDNVRDCLAKGRAVPHFVKRLPVNYARGARHGSKTMPHRLARGERHGSSKLTAEKVLEIRRRYAEGGISQRALAKQFGVAQGTIGPILRGETWTGI